jgi:phage tail protein X
MQPDPSWGQQSVAATQTYVVQKGDTLGSIARKFYGKSNLWQKLWRANRGLVANPNKLTAGDTLYIFPESTLALNKPVEAPPAPSSVPQNLYTKERLLTTAFPEFFSLAADPRGLGGTGTTRVLVKKIVVSKGADPETGEITDTERRQEIDQLYEAHEVGEIIASSDRGYALPDDYYKRTLPGRLMLSTGDIVVVRFTQDLASLLDSDTYNDYDPYFNVFPIYGVEQSILGPDASRADYGKSLGRILKFRGKLNIVSRVEGLVPASSPTSRRAKTTAANNQDLSHVSYVAKITYAEDAINLSDKVFVFIPIDPGIERRLDSPYVEPAGAYVSPGR